MNIQQILSGIGGPGRAGVLLLFLTLIQISPIQVNPWSWLAQTIGNAVNGSVIARLNEVNQALEAEIRATRERLNEHISMDDKRNADYHRTCILRFNDELIRSLPHSRESFQEVLIEIDEYEKYCNHHANYKNNRTVDAVKNIHRVYQERMEKGDFA